jgi:hypothetical protein
MACALRIWECIQAFTIDQTEWLPISRWLKTEGKPSIRLDQEQAIAVRALDVTSHLPPQHGQLMPERGVLCLKSALRRRCEQRQEEAEQRNHRRYRLGDSVTQSIRMSFSVHTVGHL